MKLHKAFIDAAAQPLNSILPLFLKNFGKPKKSMDKKVVDFMPDFWSIFFLIVPSVSTTFASSYSMLSCLPIESLGWLLIDEAGQALPQSALGALMQTKRAIVTGDPLQIEPVVILPPNLTEGIFKEFNADASRFNAPLASVQTLSDTANSYYAELKTKNANSNRKSDLKGESKSRFVGFPLLVHRRCENPMFNISNNIAYKQLMVQAKKAHFSLIRNCLGESSWIDVQAESKDKWCIEEGEIVLDMLTQLKCENIEPDLYIISPFKIVMTNLQKLIKDSNILESWGNLKPEAWIKERVGTVHIAQGREAEAVIMVLGSPMEHQSGSKSWAGGTPNLLNVAVTRAKEVFYVVGNRKLWENVGFFDELNYQLTVSSESKKVNYVIGF